jgi:hypothetical protein
MSRTLYNFVIGGGALTSYPFAPKTRLRTVPRGDTCTRSHLNKVVFGLRITWAPDRVCYSSPRPQGRLRAGGTRKNQFQLMFLFNITGVPPLAPCGGAVRGMLFESPSAREAAHWGHWSNYCLIHEIGQELSFFYYIHASSPQLS